MEEKSEINRKIGVNRFVSSFAAALRAFHLYKQNNKALDEVMNNLALRFKETVPESLKLGVTNRSLVFEGENVGSLELTRHLATHMRTLGYREIIFRSPLQSRHFFQLLNILASSDPLELKQEKLVPLTGDEDEKPICLVPVISNSLMVRMSDEAVTAKLAPLAVPAAQGGPGILEDLEKFPPDNLSDFYTRVAVKVEVLDKPLRAFVRNLLDGAREGFFPWERLLKVFPLPTALKEKFFQQITNSPLKRSRRPTALGLGFKPDSRRPTGSQPVEWKTALVAFSADEITARKDLKIFGSQQQGLAEIELAQAMLTESGSNLSLGLRILVRVLVQQNATTVQERAIKLGLSFWINRERVGEDMTILSLLSSLRQALSLPHNIATTLFPIRALTTESELFTKLSAYFVSLGEVAVPALIQALNAEEDRGMRRKLCFLLTAMAREQGTEHLIAAIENASPFLLRNIVMILGDIRSQQAIKDLLALVDHPQRIVRIEALRSIGKIGGVESTKKLTHILEHSAQMEERKIALDQLAAHRDRSLLEPLIRMARQETKSSDWKITLLNAIGAIGGAAAKQFLESQQKGASLLYGFSTSAKDEQALITTLLRKMAA